MLQHLNASVENFRGVSGLDRHGFLDDHRAGVHAVIDEMDGATGFGRTGVERLFPRFQTRESGQQGRVDVDDALGKRIQKRAFYQAEKAGEADEIDAGVLQLAGGFLLGFFGKFRAETMAIDHAGRDTAIAGTLEDECAGIVREHEADARVELAGIDRIKDRLHV
jgi:hypothetical protein